MDHKRYQFPATARQRVMRSLGLGDHEHPRASDPGELIGNAVARFHVAGEPGPDGPSLALETESQARGPVPDDWTLRPRFAATGDGRWVAHVDVDPGTSLYATGEVAGPLRRNGTRKRLWTADRPGYDADEPCLYQAHPWVLGVRSDGTAFGVLFDTTWRAELDLTRAVTLRAEGPAFAVIVIERDAPQGVLRALADLTGKMPMPPLWALGYHQCRWGYDRDSRIGELADELRSRRLPCDVIWFDIDYMQQYRVFTFAESRFPDPGATNRRLHERGFRTVWMIDPGVAAEEGYHVYDQGTERGFWVRRHDAEPFVGKVWPPRVVWPDFTREDVCAWWAELYQPYLATGIDGVWNDMNEPAVIGAEMPDDCVHDGGRRWAGQPLPPGPHARYHNTYGMQMVRASREGIARANPDKRPFVLTRSNFLGGHRYAATWTGDNSARWPDVHWSITMVLNLGLSGQPFSGPDLGGFFEPGTPEMYARWFGFGSLLPFCRNHAEKNNIDKEPWCFGPETEATVRRALERRYRLMPYLYTLFREAHQTGLPVARPVFFADPADTRLHGEDHSFLLGADLLVLADVASDRTHDHPHDHALPRGSWRACEPLEPSPDDPNLAELRLRPGAVLPLGPAMQHTGERAWDPLTLVVNLDDQGTATGLLYEDAGDGHAHEQGDYVLLRLVAERDADHAVVHVHHADGQRDVPDRAVVVRVLTDAGERRAEGRTTEPVRVPLHEH